MKPLRLPVAAAILLCLQPLHAETTNITAEAISQQEVMEAALYGKTGTIDAALKQGFKADTRDPENRTALMYAAFNGRNEIVRMLLAAGAEVDAQDGNGSTALMFAASGPSTETVQTLLDAGAKIDIIDSNEHWTALMWAAAEGQLANVELLLKNGADLTLEDIDGDTAETFAAHAGHAEVAKRLKEATKPETKETP